MKTLEERLSRAKDLRAQGYGCAQAVVMVFDDVTGIPEATAASLCAGLGTGVAGTRQICGVPNAIAIVIGATGGSAPADKVTAMKLARPLIESFAAGNDGRLTCAELKGSKGIRPCNDLVMQGVEILDGYFRSLKD